MIKRYSFRYRNAIVIVIGIVILTIVSTIFFEVIVKKIESFADWAFKNDDDQHGKVTDLLLKIFGGIILLFGLIAALIRAKSSLKNLANQTKQIELLRDSQLNEQFKNAIEHLASKDESIELGGITELHYLAIDNTEKFSRIVVEILCAKLRSKCSRTNKTEDYNVTTTQIILDYLLINIIYKDISKDFSFCDLSKNHFSSLKINNCNFENSIFPAKIEYVTFKNCKTRNSIFNNCIISNVQIENLNDLRHSFFNNCSLTKFVIECELVNLIFSGCIFSSFETSFIRNSYFYECKLENGIINKNSTYKSLSSVSFTKTSFNCIYILGIVKGCQFKVCNFHRKLVFEYLVTNCKFQGILKDKFNLSDIKFDYVFFINKKNDFSGMVKKTKGNLKQENEISILTKKDYEKLKEPTFKT